MDGSYDLSIVALSVAVAIIASYTALDMAGRVSASDSTPRKSWIWLVAGAVSMGTGIWSMHFIGMLSFDLPIQVAFDLPITLLSLIIAIAASVIALFFLRQTQLNIRNLIISTILMGTGIVAMHYTGMFAMQMSPPIRYDPLLFAASVLIAIVASFAALWISFQLRWKDSRLEILAKLGSAGVMGLAISGMHYTGMAAARFAPGSVCLAVTSGGINSTTLAFAIGSVSFVIMSFTVIVSTLDANFGKRLASANTQLRESEGKFRSLSENALDGIVMSDTEGKIRFWNPSAVRMFGYRPEEILGRSLHEILAPERYRDKANAGYSHFANTGTGDLLNRTYEFAALRKDGSEFPIELSVSGFQIDGAWNAIAIVREITERKRLAAAADYRSNLLHAASIASTQLQTALTIEDGMAKLLKTIGEAVRADRVIALENRERAGAAPKPVLLYGWHSANAPAVSSGEKAPSEFEADPWFAPLREGKAIIGVLSAMTDGAVKTQFQRLGIASSLDVPIIIKGRYWGRICVDDCRTEREWTSVEVDILQTLADMIGSAIIRDRYIKQLRDANTIIERSPTILFRLRGEPSLPLTYISHNVTMFGYDPAEMVASPQFYKSIIHPDDELKILELLARIVMEGTQSETVEFRMRTSDGIYRWVENYYTPIRDAAGRLVEIEGILTDVTEKKAAADKIMVLARTDALTGLANRATFIERLQQVFAAARRGASRFAVLYIDLDHFKEVNDTLGHSAGDLLLISAAGHLKRNCRETDLVGRLGGDEFAILQTEMSSVSDATVLASKIHSVLGTPYQLGDSKLFLSASIGISVYTDEMAGPDEMLAKADIALYRAKEDGRDQYRFHSDDLDQEMRERVTLTGDLRRALEKNEMELYYQPQVELFSGRIAGMEALIRWNHPKRGLLMPAEFLPIMEKTDAIVALGQWVLDHACEQMSSWRNAGIAPMIMAVNLSLGQLRTGDELIQFVTTTLAKWGLSPKDLELDVTESMLAYATWAYNDVLEQLQQLGVTIAIDDFGTQYSSLDYLKNYHVSRVKIPRAMITAATQQDQENAAMVRAIIGLARELNIEVMAQGVENEAQRDMLTAAPSTTKVQGFYYSAPVPAVDATELLRQRLIEPRLSQVSEASAAQ
jgi:diguanylate cyclase (GGDEF)-like protein/PAS domain S-box-containing protein